MPADALPQPWPEPLEGTVRLRRAYTDPLGRPVRGALTLSGAPRFDSGDTVAVAAPVTVKLAGGFLDVNLPPGEYQVRGKLTTTDGASVTIADTITLES